MARRPIRVVVFDIGETLLDETFAWRGWAAHLGVSLETFRAAFDGAIAAGDHHHRAFERLKPGFNLDAERAERRARGTTVRPEAADLYPDAVPCLRLLQQRGFRIGIAANQLPGRVPQVLSLLGVTPDFAGSSAEWGVEKPSPDFFARVLELAGTPAARVAYVGDRVDNDVVPSAAAGMVSVFLRRGPWGRVHAGWPDVAKATMRIDSLAELPEAIARYNRGD
jgi:FMN phosphatase YigB (HAD superfamily)